MKVIINEDKLVKKFDRRSSKIKLPYHIKYKEINSFINCFYENRSQYEFYIFINREPTKKIKDNMLYLQRTLSKKELKNLLYYMEYEDFEIKNPKITDKNEIIICASKTKTISYSAKIKNKKISSITQIFGIENFNILKYVNSDRIEELSKTKLGQRSLKHLKNYRTELDKLKDKEDEKYFIILSSMVLFAIGTTTAMDVDPMIYNKQNNNNIDKVASSMEKKNIDLIIMDEDSKWYSVKSKKIEAWLATEISEKWISRVGASKIEDVFLNSKYHFYFKGFKFISLATTRVVPVPTNGSKTTPSFKPDT